VDGDTVDVSLLWSDAIWRIRLLDCWVVDGTEADRRAAEEIQRLTEAAMTGLGCTVFVPLPEDVHIKELLTLDRVLGRLFAGELDLGEYLISQSLATATKPKPPPKPKPVKPRRIEP